MELEGYLRFRFRVETKPGQQVKLVGNHQVLGTWDPNNAVELFTDPKEYPYWTTAILLLPLGQVIEYKYLIVHTGHVDWEKIPNRKLKVTQNGAVIEDLANNGVSKITYSHPAIDEPEEVYNDNVGFDHTDSLLVVSYLLPITVSKDSQGIWQFELTKGVWQSQLYSLLISSKINFFWLGLPGLSVDSEEEQENLSQMLKKHYSCIPIFIDSADKELHNEFCSSILYKMMHNIIDITSELCLHNSENLWNAYKRVNISFADQILVHYTGQMLWVHGSQLLLLPSFISRKSGRILNIGFFLHQPFPSSEIYRVFPHREAILHALCCCDLIGFHLFEYARNFFSCCKRVLSIDIELTKGGYLGLNYYGRHIMVKSEHFGIQEETIKETLEKKVFLKALEELKKKYKGKKVILGMDSPIELAGIVLKLRAFALARRYFKEPVVFLQILVSQSSGFETTNVTEQIYIIRDEINKEAGDAVVEVIEEELTNEARYAYMSVSSGLVISSIKDGLCLQPFEYLIIKNEAQCGIILSEFTGVSTALNSPRKINPFSVTPN